MSEAESDFISLGFPSHEAFEFPNIVNVEIYRGQCPCACVHCPVGRTPYAERPGRFGYRTIAQQLFGKITAEMTRYPGRVLRVHAVGEPLLWEELPLALKSCREHAVKTWLFTSALTHDVERLEAVGRAADIIEVSLNSTDRNDYRATKGVDGFDTVTANLQRLHALKNQGAPLRLIVSRVESADAAMDHEFIRHWQASGLVDDAFVRSYHTYNDLLRGSAGAAARHEPCLVHWARFNVSAAGQVVVCFNELFKPQLDPTLVIGDLNRQTIAEVWRGSALTALRAAELGGNYSSLPFGNSLPCGKCSCCQPLRSQRQTSEHQLRQLCSSVNGVKSKHGAP